jgi:methylglutaconyl-CoA hydratase
MEYTQILLDSQPPVATITLNRPEQHNAFDETLIAELTDCYTRLSAEPEVRAIVLKGAGKSFCAGADLEWMGRMAEYSREQNLADARTLQAMFAAIADCPKVTLARVHGAALGGGAGLVAACDIAIAAHDVTFGFTEVRLGLAPSVIAPYVLQKIGVGPARALFVTGERFGADIALRLGLVQEVEAWSLDNAIQKKLEGILQAGPEAVAAVKRLLKEIAGRTPTEAAEATVECIASLRVSAEGQEGINAFLEKRKPSFHQNHP